MSGEPKIQHDILTSYSEMLTQLMNEKKSITPSQYSAILERYKLESICSNKIFAQRLEANDICQDYNTLRHMYDWSVITIAVSIGALLLIWFCGYIGRLSRRLLLFLFIFALIIVQLVIVFLVAANALLLVYSLYYAESYWFGSVHVGIIVLVSGMALAVVIGIISQIPTIFKKPTMTIIAKIITKDKYPKLWESVNKLATSLGTLPPDQIIAGLDINFFVTEAAINCLDGKQKGRTLYISLPLLRVFTAEEVRSVLSHEFAHFTGDDTKYTRWFYPIFNAATSSLEVISSSTDENNGLHSLVILPSQVLVSYFLYAFYIAERKLSRGRELRADKIGSKGSSNNSMALALLKIHAYSPLTENIDKLILENLTVNKQFENLCEVFMALVQIVKDNNISNDLLRSHIEHPTDSHPTLEVRLKNLNVEFNILSNELLKTHETIISDLDDFSEMETQLTDLQYAILLESMKSNERIDN